MKKPLKINQKSMRERGRKKGCQNDGKRSQKGAEMEPGIRSKRPQGAEGEPKGRPRRAKGRQREPEGSQREPKGAKREPKGSQKTIKMHPKVDQ